MQVDMREVIDARFIWWDEDGDVTVEDVDLPGALPTAGNRWRLDGSGATLCLVPQKETKEADLPDLPEQDMSIVFGGPCTSGLVFGMQPDVPPLLVRATVDLVNDYLDNCHRDSCGKVPDRATTVTNDGTTYVLGDPDTPRSQKSVMLVETLYGCRKRPDFWHRDLDVAVRDMRWVCCDDLAEALLPEVPATAIDNCPTGALGLTVGDFFSLLFEANGAFDSWQVTAGTLPAGLTLNTANGALAGTPTNVGTEVVTISVIVDGIAVADCEMTLTVAAGAGGTGNMITETLVGDVGPVPTVFTFTTITTISDVTVRDSGGEEIGVDIVFAGNSATITSNVNLMNVIVTAEGV